jgi:tRNA (cytidine/uridine-2'-O-)-methyltransferase|tara:strand:- start:310 stop:762 length:453 start_codon:yes stop_codon:yes gene_type:complete
MINIALYQPDIPQNTAAIIRLGACLNVNVHIISPCGFNLNDSRFKRVAMDYTNFIKIYEYENYNDFKKRNLKSRIILITTKGTKSYHNFKFKENDILLFGRESAGVPKKIHKEIKEKLKVPMQKKTRSLNVAITAAIVVSEALRQNNLLD